MDGGDSVDSPFEHILKDHIVGKKFVFDLYSDGSSPIALEMELYGCVMQSKSMLLMYHNTYRLCSYSHNICW